MSDKLPDMTPLQDLRKALADELPMYLWQKLDLTNRLAVLRELEEAAFKRGLAEAGRQGELRALACKRCGNVIVAPVFKGTETMSVPCSCNKDRWCEYVAIMAPPADVPSKWLWGKLCGWCVRRGVNITDYNDLIEIAKSAPVIADHPLASSIPPHRIVFAQWEAVGCGVTAWGDTREEAATNWRAAFKDAHGKSSGSIQPMVRPTVEPRV